MGIREPVAFLRQTFSTFNTTGAVAPSSSYLARAMVKHLPDDKDIPADFKVLEVGPGTGAFTAAIARKMNGCGSLQVYEINSSFVAHLKARVESEPDFQSMRGRMQITEGNILELRPESKFDAIISGLPFNNFTPPDVRGFLDHFKTLIKPGGTLTFFEYVAVRELQMPFVSAARRERLRGIAKVVNEFANAHQFDQKKVILNVPPARARHLRF